ncbi:hypothetical protein HNP99_000135 [Flavobacterium sp. 28A]|uniref:hypothetical protein n=1 Tax=Flavobacterium sp. 28A TaxID=2735895 RepID=UPI00156E2033|nr:hypothetical protein [Flavobacterium sp. 28A]NRT13810.1 hypothetical protein [Flavobacterium sp. 28A]
MLTKLKVKLSIALFAVILTKYNGHCQSASETLLYNWYDNSIGKENLAINNGSIHVNPYKTIGENNMYYITDKYSKGIISYEGQIYNDVDIKYDIFTDQLILKPYGESNYIGVNLILEKIDFFYLNDKKFVNLSYHHTDLPEFINGYYEISVATDINVLYIKHHKNMREKINNNHIFKEFKEKYEFLINYKNSYYKIENKKDIIQIFPKHKSKISAYYSKNKNLEKSDEIKFMENLLRYINFSN